MATELVRQQSVRRRTFAQWIAENPTLRSGEFGGATGAGDTIPVKLGDGTKAWNDLGWFDARVSFSLSCNEADHTGLTKIRTNRVPRVQLPDGVTSRMIFGPIGIPTWWYGTEGIVFGFDVVNDHTAGGNVRFEFVLQKNDVGGAIASAATPLNIAETLTAPGAGVLTTLLVNGGNPTAVTGGTFGSLWTFELSRIGGDALDTLGGPLSIAEFVLLAAQ
jgi:hypothetical protein